MKRNNMLFCCLLTSTLLLGNSNFAFAADMDAFTDNGEDIQQDIITENSSDSGNIFEDGSDNMSIDDNDEFSAGNEYADAGTVSENVYGYFFYKIGSDGYIEITEYVGKDTDVVVPEEINGRYVESIGKNVFKNNKTITSIELPDYLYSIGDGAFEGCENLQTVNSTGITEIGAHAFSGCKSLENISLTGITSVGDYAFKGTALKKVYLDCLNTLGKGVFSNCTSLETVYADAKYISEEAFYNCTVLTNVNLPDVTEIGRKAFMYCSSLSNISTPELQNIGDYAFSECKSLTELDLNTVEKIGIGAFYNASNIYKVHFSSELTTIDNGAFAGCSSFKEIILPDNIDRIGLLAFGYDSNEDYNMRYENYSFGNQNNFHKIEDISIHCGNGSEGNVYAVRNEFPFTFHEFKEVFTKPATEAETGEIQTICDICNQVKERTEIPLIKRYLVSAKHFVYNGSIQKPTVTVYDSTGNVISSENYDVTYSADSIEPGTYTVTLTFKGNYSGTRSIEYFIDDNKATISAENLNVILGSKNKKLNVKATGDYNGLSYKSSNSKVVSVSADGKITAKKVGTVIITITAGATDRHDAVTKKITVKVIPKRTQITSISKAGKGKLKLVWKTVSGVDGYVIYRDGFKIKTIKGSSISSYTNSSLRNGTRYDYEIRTYKKVNGKVYYSNYSDTKGATTQSISVVKQFGGSYNLDGNGYGVVLKISQGTDPEYDAIPNGGICARIDVSIRIMGGGVSHSSGYLIKKGGNNYTISGSGLSGGKVKMGKNGLTISGISGGSGKYTLTERYRS